METLEEDQVAEQHNKITKQHEDHHFLRQHAGKFRRHSSAVVMHRDMPNGFHRRPVELYLIRLNPPCRAVWLYMLQVSFTLTVKYLATLIET